MGALLVTWLVVVALPLPPTDDGPGCEKWAVAAARELLSEPQPPASGLDGVTTGGLSTIPDADWTALGSYSYPDVRTTGPWRAVREGDVPYDAVPELAAAVTALREPLGRVLQAGLGPWNRLPRQGPGWCAFRCAHPDTWGKLSIRLPTLALAVGWRALELRDLATARLSCLGLAGVLRAQAGTSLLGQMRSAAYMAALGKFCTALGAALP